MRWPHVAVAIAAAGLFVCNCSLNPHPLPPNEGMTSVGSEGGNVGGGSNQAVGPGSSSGGSPRGSVDAASGAVPGVPTTDGSTATSSGLDGSVRGDGGPADARGQNDVTVPDGEAPDGPSDAATTVDAPAID